MKDVFQWTPSVAWSVNRFDVNVLTFLISFAVLFKWAFAKDQCLPKEFPILNPIQDGLFRGCSRMASGKNSAPPPT